MKSGAKLTSATSSRFRLTKSSKWSRMNCFISARVMPVFGFTTSCVAGPLMSPRSSGPSIGGEGRLVLVQIRIERPCRPSQQLRDKAVHARARAGAVVFLKLKDGGDLPRRRPRAQHGLALLLLRDVDERDFASDDAGDALGDLGVGHGVRTVELVGLAIVPTGLAEDRSGDRAHIAYVHEADPRIAHGRIECAVGANALGVVGHDILHEAVRTQDRVSKSGGLQLRLDLDMPAREGFRETTRPQRRVQHDMTHSGRPARVDHVAFKFDKLRDRSADEKDALDPVQRPKEALAIAEVGDGCRHSCGRLAPSCCSRYMARNGSSEASAACRTAPPALPDAPEIRITQSSLPF